MAPRKKQIEKEATVETPETVTGNTADTNDTIHVGDLVYDRAILDTVLAGTDANGFEVIAEVDSAKLVELGLITVNPDGADENGNIQAAVTDKGREAHAFNHSEEGQAESESVAKKARRKSDVVTPDAELSDVEVPMPAPAPRGRRGEEKYPFASLTVGGATGSFHISTAELSEDAHKEILGRMYSSVSTANERYKTVKHPIGGAVGANYKARAVGADDPKGKGVRVWRMG